MEGNPKDGFSWNEAHIRPPRKEYVTEKYFSYFSIKMYVVGTNKNRPNETVLLSTQNTCLN